MNPLQNYLATGLMAQQAPEQELLPRQQAPAFNLDEFLGPAPQMAQQERMDPKSMLWAGVLMDIGNFLGNPFEYQPQALGIKMMTQAKQHNAGIDQQDYQVKMAQRQEKLGMLTPDIKEWNMAGRPMPLEQWITQSKQRATESQAVRNALAMGLKQGTPEFNEYVRKATITQPGDSAQERMIDEMMREDPALSYTQAIQRLPQTQAVGRALGTVQGGLQGEALELAENSLPMLYQSIGNVDTLAAAIERGEFSETGPAEGLYKKYTNPQTAELEVVAIYQALQNLQITNLAPVSNTEIEMVRSMYADIGRDPAANLGRLKAARKIMTDKVALAEAKIRRHGFGYMIDRLKGGGGGGSIDAPPSDDDLFD